MTLYHFGTNILMFGLGDYRASAVYLASVPAANFESGAGTFYFTGLSNGQPSWSSAETNAVPMVTDSPVNPTIGNVSVNYSPAVGLWLMTYDGGRQKPNQKSTTGVYFAFAPAPWGPWSTPQLIFNRFRDGAEGAYIYDASNSSGPAGPTIDPANNPPDSAEGGEYAPYMIERFTTVRGSMLTIYLR